MMATPPNIPTILIVDDDAANREAMARLLEHAGYRSLSAGDVPTARRILVEARPDLLITDVHRAHALALIEHEPDGLSLEVVIELPARPALGSVCHRSGHRIHLSEDVHETGSSAQPRGMRYPNHFASTLYVRATIEGTRKAGLS